MDSKLKGFLDRNILLVTGKVTDDTLHYMQEAVSDLLLRSLNDNKSSQVTLIISTGGGRHALAIYDLLNLYPGKIIGLVVECAYSAGSLILQACDTRLATPNSSILIHHGSTGEVPLDDFMDEKALAKLVAEKRASTEARYQIYCKRSGKTREQVQQLCFENRKMSLQEAIEFGLVDGIWEGPPPIDSGMINWPEK